MTLSHTLRRPSWCSYLPKTVWTVLNERHRILVNFLLQCVYVYFFQLEADRSDTFHYESAALYRRFCYLCQTLL